MTDSVLQAERDHLAGLLEAIQRCTYFLDASIRKVGWPLTAEYLSANKKNVALFESLASINERFAKLQDALGAAMRHAMLLAGEQGNTFLKVLAFYEKMAVLDSIESWQICRTTRNLAAHDYDIEYAEIAKHFNTLCELTDSLYGDAVRFLRYCEENLAVTPAYGDFANEFTGITRNP